MVTYTVHEPPEPPADRVDRADELRFVKDGFSWLTAFVPPLGFALKGLWLALAGYIAAVAVICTALPALGVSSEWVSLVVTALSLYAGFEVSTMDSVYPRRRIASCSY